MVPGTTDIRSPSGSLTVTYQIVTGCKWFTVPPDPVPFIHQSTLSNPWRALPLHRSAWSSWSIKVVNHGQMTPSHILIHVLSICNSMFFFYSVMNFELQ